MLPLGDVRLAVPLEAYPTTRNPSPRIAARIVLDLHHGYSSAAVELTSSVGMLLAVCRELALALGRIARASIHPHVEVADTGDVLARRIARCRCCGVG